jgi:hypothetical protein
MDETGLFYHALPDKSLVVRGTDCAGGKWSKERLTVTVCVNAVGEFEKPIVIGKSAKPHCFGNIDVSALPVTWISNKTAWMTSAIFDSWLQEFDRKMGNQKRKVFLLLDNASWHSQDLKLQNVKLIFLPPNTTSVLQPLDLGIIQNIKVQYRTRLLRFVLGQVNAGIDKVSKCVTVLDACYWINASINEVKPHCIQHCFRKAGIEIEN